MAKDDQQEAFEKVLTADLLRGIDFIKFAEAKNAAAVTFCSAWILGLTNFLLNSKDIWTGFYYFLPISIFLFMLSVVTSFYSFLPKTKIAYFYGSDRRPSNLLYVGDIERLSEIDLKDRLLARYLPPDGKSMSDHYIDDLVQQISIVSKIAMAKFRCFNKSALLLLAALFIAALPTVWHLAYFSLSKISIKVG